MKRLIFSTIINIIFFAIIYLFIFLYDQNGITISRITNNIYYIIFLFLSSMIIFSLLGNEKKQSKIIIYSLLIINLLYLFFIFSIGNIGFSKLQGILFIIFLIIGFGASYIKHWIGYIFIGISILIDLLILFLAIVPLYNEGIDTSEFEDKYTTNLIIYSNIGINKNKANIQKDTKTYEIKNGLNNYNFYVNNQGSQILFKSDNLYPNIYGFLVFAGGEFITISPQSAITISKDNEIEILNGDIRYYPENPTKFQFIGENKASLETSNNIEIINNRYKSKLKIYVKGNMLGDISLNTTILKISNTTLQILNKIFPNKYKNNIKNIQEYIDLFDIDFTKTNYKNEIDTKNILRGFENGLNKIN